MCYEIVTLGCALPLLEVVIDNLDYREHYVTLHVSKSVNLLYYNLLIHYYLLG